MNVDLLRHLPVVSTPESSKLKPLKLHILLGGADAWTDELWDEAMRYLDGRLSLPQSVNYKTLLFRLQRDAGQYPALPGFQIAKRDNLAGYRDFEPKPLLAAFDYFREHGHDSFARAAYMA